MSTGYAITLKLATGSTVACDWIYSNSCWYLATAGSSTQRASAESLAQEQNAVVSTYLSELVDYIHRGSADKKGESGSRGLQKPANTQKEGSAVTPTFDQRVQMAQRRIVQTVLDADANRALSQDAAERDRERRRKEASCRTLQKIVLSIYSGISAVGAFVRFQQMPKALCAKAGLFDMVTNEMFNFMVAITAGLKFNWIQILFQVFLSMVNKPKRQSQGFAVQVSVFLERMVKSDLVDSIKLHPQKLLTNKSVLTYIKKNQKKPTGETSKQTEDSDSNTDGESTISLPLKDFAKRRRTQRQPKQKGSTGANVDSRPNPIPDIPTKEERFSGEDNLVTGQGRNERTDSDQDVKAMVVMPKQPSFQTMMLMGQGIFYLAQTQEIDQVTYFFPKINPISKGKETLAVMNKPAPVEEHCQLALKSAWDNFLNKELKEIATMHRAQRVIAGLPIVSPEASFIEYSSYKTQLLALEFSGQAEQEQALVQLIVQQVSENEAVKSQSIRLTRLSHQFKKTSISLWTMSTGIIVNMNMHSSILWLNNNNNMHDTDHQGPSPSNLRMVAYTTDSEEDTRLSFLGSSESSHTGSQQMIVSSPPESPPVYSKLDEVDKVVA
ncbi:hypothetical protein F511_42008 [Dorcoceras hygrometricum]|uniref:Uncharacterized protein n=1 Tax=Dorcoceras hygrometricum TaxID=472368 RepID=A0A2Z7B0W3_9LAMI|nr:hypothetical protein F511_42008 [Dorcoceras hygrometricum]